MKKIYWLLGLLATCYSCSEIEEYSNEPPLHSSLNSTTRAAGDEKFDVLGYGYDATSEYLHPLSIRNPVLNIAKYEQDYTTRLQVGNSSFGYDKMYYGYSSFDYIKDITTETEATVNMNYGSEKDTMFFSGNITNNSFLKTEYSYSDKYSFASLDAIRNHKYIYINDEVGRMSDYLTDDFKEDLDRLSPDRIVERYGTHVLTNFIIGGRYKLVFRSVIANIKDESTKKRAVNSGFKYSLDGIGFSYNLNTSETVHVSLAKENRSKEMYVLFYGGSGTNIKYDLEKGAPTSIDIQSWENSVSLGNSCLTDINWKETYPIYAFISDPIKKQEIKSAVERYIKASQLRVQELLPLYSYYTSNGNHYTTTINNIVESYPGWEILGVEGYIFKNKELGTTPLYVHYNSAFFDHYTTNISYIEGKNWQNFGVIGYIYKKSTIETIPIYEYYCKYNKNNFDHYTTIDPHIVQNFPGWELHQVSGYIFPKD